jgi:NAD(P)-dependent dehydrogenase (short-subunit alcohol dehydrogenase family)
MTTGRLRTKTAIVAGAGSHGRGWGVGKAIAVAFAREGARVVCVDLDAEAAQETARLIADEDGAALALRADPTQAEDWARAVSTTLAAFGRVDILAHYVEAADDVPEEGWERTFALNLTSCRLAMQEAIPAMERQGGGSFVAISSIASIRATPATCASQAASKAALNQLARVAAARHAAQNVRVNTILSGLLGEPTAGGTSREARRGEPRAVQGQAGAVAPIGRSGSAWDVAHAAVFLASDEAAFITGVELVVDGGLTLGY